MSYDYIYHHGIKGMRWGIRRFRNKDGSLTEAGKKRVRKEYKKTSDKAMSTLSRKYPKMYIDSYNKAADYMNSKGIDKFNSDQKNKYGDNYAKRSGYEDDYMKFFEDRLTKTLNQSLDDFYRSDPDVQKARDMVKKYNMTEWDDLARNNEAAINSIRESL